MPQTAAYTIVKLANGAHSVHSGAYGETFHPGIGPVAEAETLYVRQLRLPERVEQTGGEFVLWDVGLGAAANALTAIRLIRNHLAGQSAAARESRAPKMLRVVSFDRTCDALAFALQHGAELGYVTEHETALAELMANHSTLIPDGLIKVEWTLQLGFFQELISFSQADEVDQPERRSPIRRDASNLQSAGSETGAPTSQLQIENQKSKMAPHAILFDPHSPKKNPEMWTAALFAALFRRLDPQRPCSLASFTRSTMARVAMLLGGFFVGVGRPSGLKEETTVAANRLELLVEPLDRRWIERAKRSGSAEPLREPVYRQMPLSPETWEQLRRHPQFQ